MLMSLSSGRIHAISKLCLAPNRSWIHRSEDASSLPALLGLHCSSHTHCLEWCTILSCPSLLPSGSLLNPFWLKLLRTLCPLGSGLLEHPWLHSRRLMAVFQSLGIEPLPDKESQWIFLLEDPLPIEEREWNRTKGYRGQIPLFCYTYFS